MFKVTVRGSCQKSQQSGCTVSGAVCSPFSDVMSDTISIFTPLIMFSTFILGKNQKF